MTQLITIREKRERLAQYSDEYLEYVYENEVDDYTVSRVYAKIFGLKFEQSNEQYNDEKIPF